MLVRRTGRPTTRTTDRGRARRAPRFPGRPARPSACHSCARRSASRVGDGTRLFAASWLAAGGLDAATAPRRQLHPPVSFASHKQDTDARAGSV